MREVSPDRGVVIFLHRPDGREIVLNSDLIESVEAGAETTLTLFDGRIVLVRESCFEIAAAVKDFRAQVLAGANAIADRRADLKAVPFRKF